MEKPIFGLVVGDIVIIIGAEGIIIFIFLKSFEKFSREKNLFLFIKKAKLLSFFNFNL